MRLFINHLLLIIVLIAFGCETGRAQVSDFQTQDGYLEYCEGDTVSFQNLSVDYDYLHWFFGDSTDTYTHNPAHIYTEPGSYSVSLVASSHTGGADSSFLNIQIHPLPQLILDLPSDTVYASSQSYMVRASGEYDRLEWSNGNVGESISISQTGHYSATAYFDDTGCRLVRSFYLIFSGTASDTEAIQVINNVITANDDGINDYLIISKSEEVGSCELSVFDSAGHLLFSDKDYDNTWKGRDASGRYLSTGTYFYIIRAEGFSVKKGFVDIIRPL